MPTPAPIGVIVADAGTVTTSLLTVVTSTITTIVSQPLLLIPVLLGLTITGIGIFRKLRA